MHAEYAMLKGERSDSEDGSRYILHGLPAGTDFREEEEYFRIEAAHLSVEGVGFAAPTFEFSQHGHRVIVEQDTPGGHADIRFVSDTE